MTLLIIGLALWVLAHSFKRLAPNLRVSLGDPGKGIVAVLLLAGLVLMIIGYRSAPIIPVWTPPSFMVHLNNLLMVVAVAVFAMSHTKGRLRGRMRHPMLTSVKLWSVAHLLVNGDLASILLFGAMLAWAVGSVVMINRAEAWERPAPGDRGRDVIFIVITVVTFAVMVGIHMALGVNPFPG